MRLDCDNIEATKATQARVKLSKDMIDQYTEDIKNGAVFPPVDVFCWKSAERNILADGFQRLIAHINAGEETIAVKMHEGGMHEALIFALGANAGHGLRRSNADKIHAVKMALKDPEISQMKQQEIADICRVDRKTVNRTIRRETLDENEQEGVPKVQQPEENTPENNRPTKAPPTQADIERGELREAMGLIRAFPYGGDRTERWGLSQDDINHINYCIDWLTEALEAHVAAQYKSDVLRDSEYSMATEQ